MLLGHFDLHGSLPQLGQLDVELFVIHQHHGPANLHGVGEEMLVVLGFLGSLDWSFEGPK